ncbi:MAG: hypothetical protein IPO90_04065 [Flavobacteriales bacterium]|nr:hypothetical protein [Flavobacteriales bacterium]
MQNEPIVQLRRVRDFGQTISDTFTFLKENWKPLYSAIGVVGLPPLIIVSLLMKFGMGSLDLSANSDGGMPEGLPSFFFSVFVAYIAILFVYLLCYAMVNEYMRACTLNEQIGITTRELLSRGFSQLGSYFGLGFLSILMIMGGTILCFLPGIYLAIVLMIGPSCHAMERAGATGSISRSFKLMKDEWWETFGLVIIIGLIQWVIQQALSLPIMLLMGISMFAGMGPNGNDPEATMVWFRTVFPIVMILGLGIGMITYPIGAIAASMRYFTLVEKKEAVGLGDEVKRFDQL